MKKNVIATVLLFLLTAISAVGQTKKERKALDALQELMQGQYSSEAHSKRDTTYFNISLRMVPIWKNKGHYLYVEQALFTKQEKPYRVRIYKLSMKGDQFISAIYTLKNEKDWYGKWKTPEAFDQLTEDNLELKPGCEVVLNKIGKDHYAGATGAQSCTSELRGASYATSKVTLTKNSILSWDQGFDKNGQQVWGAEKGGYEFVKY